MIQEINLIMEGLFYGTHTRKQAKCVGNEKSCTCQGDCTGMCRIAEKRRNFPLSSPGKLAVFGNEVRNTVKGGTGSGDVNVRHFVTVEEGLRNAGFTITSASWLDGYDTFCEAGKE